MSDAVQIPAQAVAFFLWKLSRARWNARDESPSTAGASASFSWRPTPAASGAGLPACGVQLRGDPFGLRRGPLPGRVARSDHRKLGAGMTVTFELRDPEAAAAPPAGAHHAPHAPAPAGMAGPTGSHEPLA